MGNGTLTWGTGATLVPSAAPDVDLRSRALLEGHFVFVWRLLRRLGVAESDVDDAVQQVFIVATRKLDRIAPSCERSFLFGTAIRVAAAWRRKRPPTLDANDELFAVPDHGRAPDEMIARKQAIAVLDRIIDSMPDELRVVFVLCEIEELPIPEVAALQQIPAGTAASRLRRARREFQEGAKRAILRARARGAKP